MNPRITLLMTAVMQAGVVGLLLVMANAPEPRVAGPLPLIVATIGSVLCIGWSLLKLGPMQSPKQFQTNAMVALAFAEFVGLIGFVMDGTPQNQWKYAVACWLLMLILIFPRIAR